MPASEAQIKANQANSLKSSGPKTPEGLRASSANSLKHGLTATKLIPELEAEEVDRRFVAFCEELRPSGEVGVALVRQAATMSVRAERCFEYENAMDTERVRRAEADFVPPEGVDEATAARLRTEAGMRALIDNSRDALLARKYEAAAQNGFLRALKELRQIEKTAKAARVPNLGQELGSFFPPELSGLTEGLKALSDDELEDLYVRMSNSQRTPPPRGARPVDVSGSPGGVDVPFAVGKKP